jgi:lipid A 3-O-deacylase
MIRAGWVAGAVLALAASILPGAARADDDPGLLALGIGAFDFDHRQPAAEFRGEWRFSQGLWLIKPLLGAFVTSRGSFYGYFGLRADIILAEHYVIMPVAAFGYYDKGNGKDLGSHAEFKTGVEFAYRFDNAMRLGLAFDHISNAGITQKNPGTENLLVVLSLPL